MGKEYIWMSLVGFIVISGTCRSLVVFVFSSLIEMSFNQIVLLTNGGGVSTIMVSWQSNLKLYCSFAIEINDAPRLIILKVYFWYLEIITIKLDN